MEPRPEYGEELGPPNGRVALCGEDDTGRLFKMAPKILRLILSHRDAPSNFAWDIPSLRPTPGSYTESIC